MTNCRPLVIATLALAMAMPVVSGPLVVLEQNLGLRGRITRVTDGDTVSLLDADKNQIKMRWAGIDAPEAEMPYGPAARAYLANLVLDKQVLAVTQKKYRYGRTVATLILGTKDVNLAMVQAGLAWHYKQYVRQQSEPQAVAYAQSEIDARTQAHGLWQDEKPTAPWDWRNTQTGMVNGLSLINANGISLQQGEK